MEKNSIIRIPPCPNLPSRKQAVLDGLYSKGDYSGAAIYLAKQLDYPNYKDISSQTIHELKDYIDKKKKASNSNGTVLTTHKRFVQSNFSKMENAIIDEDILSDLLPVGIVNKSFLLSFLFDVRELINSEKYAKFLMRVTSSTVVPLKTPQFNIDVISVKEIISKYQTPIASFLESEWYMIGDRDEIYFISRNEPSKYDKTLILSATASSFIYSRLFPNLRIIDCGEAEHEGERIQFSDFSWSKSAMMKESYLTKRIPLINQLKNRPIITFKRLKNLFNNPSCIILEQPTGSNIHEGGKIAVVGTPHLPDYVYLLYAKILGIEYEESDVELSNILICWNGFEFKFMTFKHKELREIQLSLIESKLEQAIGRARTIRHKAASVYLFSNYPLRGFEQKYFHELEYATSPN